MIRCSGKCGQELPEDDFCRNRRNKKTGRSYQCRKCTRAQIASYPNTPERRHQKNVDARVYYNRHKDEPAFKRRQVGYQKKQNYGITMEQFEQMAAEQDGHCAICGIVPKNLYVDHNHITNKIRGLLCNHCNLGLGHFRDNLTTVQIAVDYLKKYEETK